MMRGITSLKLVAISNVNNIDRRRKAVLIVECDSARLARQNLALGEQLHSSIKLAFQRNPVDLVRADTEADLLKQLGTLSERGQCYRSIVIIGHSNKSGLKLTADRFSQWGAVARWFGPFDPHRIILIACEAGRWLPCAELFKGIPNLKEIFGSPVPAHKDQVWIVFGMVLYALGARKMNKEWLKLMQIGNFLMTKGLMFRRTRKEYQHCSNAEGELWDETETLIAQVAEMLRG